MELPLVLISSPTKKQLIPNKSKKLLPITLVSSERHLLRASGENTNRKLKRIEIPKLYPS